MTQAKAEVKMSKKRMIFCSLSMLLFIDYYYFVNLKKESHDEYLNLQ